MRLITFLLGFGIALATTGCASAVPVGPSDNDPDPKIVRQQARTTGALSATGGVQRSQRYVLISSTGLASVSGDKSNSSKYMLRGNGVISEAPKPTSTTGQSAGAQE